MFEAELIKLVSSYVPMFYSKEKKKKENRREELLAHPVLIVSWT